MKKKRIAIYILFDEDGLLDSYRSFFLKKMKMFCDTIIVVVNGELHPEEKEKLEVCCEYVFYRSNEGFEMKAFEEVFLRRFERAFWKEYDELILCNDSFYGPFCNMDDIFAEMESKNVDYWAIGKVCNWYMQYLASYFVVYRKKILESEALVNYFELCKDYSVTSINHVVQQYEVGLCKYLEYLGYHYSSYIEDFATDILKHPDEYVIKKNHPFLRRKTFLPNKGNDIEIKATLKYLSSRKLYDTDIILDNAKRKYGYKAQDYIERGGEKDKKESCILCCEDEIMDFINNHPDIYIYGAGNMGGKVWFAYRYYMKNFKGFIVSDNQKLSGLDSYGMPIHVYSEIKEDIACIIAIKNEYAEVLKHKKVGDIFCVLPVSVVERIRL